MTNRERAIAFVASLPKFEGMQRISPTDPERYKVYKDLIDKLEKEFDKVNAWHGGITALPARKGDLGEKLGIEKESIMITTVWDATTGELLNQETVKGEGAIEL